MRARLGAWRAPDALVGACLVVAGIGLTLPFSGPDIRETPDGLYYEAQKREIQGEPRDEAREEVFASGLAAPLKEEERALSPQDRRVDNPAWVEYSERFYRRRWTVPVIAAGIEPIAGDRSLEETALLGWALLPAALYLLLRRRFDPFPSLGAAAFATVLPPLWQFGHWPTTDSWGLLGLVVSLLLIMQVRNRGARWLPVWVVSMLVLSFTRDLTIVPLIAAGWLAFRERSRLMAGVLGTGVLASLPAPLIFSAPLRENLAYAFNDYRIPTDTSWGAILSDYPSQLSSLLLDDLKYPADGPFPPVLTIAMGIVAIAALLILLAPGGRHDAFLALIRSASIGGLLTILISVNYTELRLELVFVPAVAAGLALGLERLLARGVRSGTDAARLHRARPVRPVVAR